MKYKILPLIFAMVFLISFVSAGLSGGIGINPKPLPIELRECPIVEGKLAIREIRFYNDTRMRTAQEERLDNRIKTEENGVAFTLDEKTGQLVEHINHMLVWTTKSDTKFKQKEGVELDITTGDFFTSMLLNGGIKGGRTPMALADAIMQVDEEKSVPMWENVTVYENITRLRTVQLEREILNKGFVNIDGTYYKTGGCKLP